MQGMDLVNSLPAAKESSLDISRWVAGCYKAMNDDFNSPVLIAHLFEGVKYVNLVNDGKETLLADDVSLLQTTLKSFVFDVLGLVNEIGQSNSDKLNGVVALLIRLRTEARENKNWKLSDQIRDELLALGVQLKDGKEGTTFSVN